MYFDPVWLLVVGPFILLSLIATVWVRSAFSRGSRIAVRSGLTGAQVARMILDDNGLRNVPVDIHEGALSDHYDPRTKSVHLSPEVYSGRSIASVSVAAHEVGHALQDGTRYPLLGIRNAAVPVASFGSQACMLLAFLGIALASMGARMGFWVLVAAATLYAGVVFFQVVNLPVEFNASSRAKRILLDRGIVTADEAPAVSKVLNAAAMTYVAATLTAIATLVWLLLRANAANDRR